MYRTYCLLYLVLVILGIGCVDTSKTKNGNLPITANTSRADVIEIDTLANRLSRLIGGKDSVLNYENDLDTAFIRQFAALTSEKFLRIKESRLERMRAWNQNNLVINHTSDSAFVFYPFSGGDFIHVNALYPNASEYLMVAQEDVGDVPNLFVKGAAYANQYLSDIDTVLRDIYNKSYFITKNMIEDTKKRTLVNGMLPLILWAAVNSDHEIVKYRYLVMNDSSGELQVIQPNLPSSKPDAVEVVLKVKGKENIRKVTYLSCDISNSGFVRRSSFLRFLKSKIPANCNSFVKSASYLMHNEVFSVIRDLLLEKSNYLLQDDTGIPFRYFSTTAWNLHLYGIYNKPVKDFDSSLYQKDLSIAYLDSSLYRGPINFSLGYHWGSNKQNQLIAVKK